MPVEVRSMEGLGVAFAKVAIDYFLDNSMAHDTRTFLDGKGEARE